MTSPRSRVVHERDNDRDDVRRIDIVEPDAELLARLIKRATRGRGWCSTPPLAIARYLLMQGVALPDQSEGER